MAADAFDALCLGMPGKHGSPGLERTFCTRDDSLGIQCLCRCLYRVEQEEVGRSTNDGTELTSSDRNESISLPGLRISDLNCRVPKCESCGTGLLPDLLFTREQIADLDAQHEKSRKSRSARSRSQRTAVAIPEHRGQASRDFGGGCDGGESD